MFNFENKTETWFIYNSIQNLRLNKAHFERKGFKDRETFSF